MFDDFGRRHYATPRAQHKVSIYQHFAGQLRNPYLAFSPRQRKVRIVGMLELGGTR
jgi:hypothetical protein